MRGGIYNIIIIIIHIILIIIRFFFFKNYNIGICYKPYFIQLNLRFLVVRRSRNCGPGGFFRRFVFYGEASP